LPNYFAASGILAQVRNLVELDEGIGRCGTADAMMMNGASFALGADCWFIGKLIYAE
jgi:hypothetical protein